MPRLIFYPDKLNNVVIPSIIQTTQTLNSAVSMLSKASVPSGCNVNISSITSEINNIISNLNDLRIWAQDSVSLLCNTESSFSDLALSLPKESIPIREEKIFLKNKKEEYGG